jgi:hypothetical protein
MKTILKILPILLLGSMPVLAQDANQTDYRQRLMGGIKGGFNYSNVYDTRGEEFTTEPKSGWVGGVFVSIPVNQLVGVNFEAMFSQKGFKGKGLILSRKYELKRTTNFLDFPVFITLKPSEFISFLGGLQYSYLIKQTDEFGAGVTTIEQELEFQNAGIRRHFLGLAGGVDVNMKHLVLGFRGSFDFLNNDGNNNGSSTPSYRNALLQATVGYRLYRD